MLDSLLTRPGSTPAALLDALARRLGAAGVAADVLTHAALAGGAAGGGPRARVIPPPPGLLGRGGGRVFGLMGGALPRLAGAAAYVYAGLEVVTAAQRFRYGRRTLG